MLLQKLRHYLLYLARGFTVTVLEQLSICVLLPQHQLKHVQTGSVYMEALKGRGDH